MKTKTDQEAYGQMPPQAIDVEKAVLGALLLEPDAYSSISGIIDTHSFYVEKHQIIFKTIKALKKKGIPVDLVTVTEELKKSGELKKISPTYVTQLTTLVVCAANIEKHARIIAEKYYKRESIGMANEIIKMAYNDEDVEILGNTWRNACNELEDVFTVADSGTIFKNVLSTTVKEIEDDCKKAECKKTPGIPTGFHSVDINSGGWRNGNLIILAARPGVGKTSFALHFTLEAAKAGYWVNLFSLEMTKEDLARTILASESDIYRSDIRDGILQQQDWDKINKAIPTMENLPIIFKDSSGMNVNQIQATIRKNKKHKRCDFAIVDYLQLVKAQNPKAVRELEVSEISRTLKTTALQENIPIMALSQLNRAAEGETPKLSHLRESGAIEQDADFVCFLSKPDTNSNIVRFSVAKHRRGKLGDINIFCDPEMTRFSETPQLNYTETPQAEF